MKKIFRIGVALFSIIVVFIGLSLQDLEPNIHKTGQPASVGDLAFEVFNVERMKHYNGQQADQGYEFIKIGMKVKNNYIENIELTKQSFMLLGTNLFETKQLPFQSLTATPGSTVKRYLVYQVPENQRGLGLSIMYAINGSKGAAQFSLN